MKKIVSLIGVIAILLTMSVSVFAEDIPEALAFEDDAKIFIGTLKDFRLDSSKPKVLDVQVLPTRKIKGEVAIDELQTYKMCHFGKLVQKEKEYLFGWLSDDSIWAYEIVSYNEKEIKIETYDEFAERIQSFLDNGIYEKLENERLSKIEQSTHPDSSSTSVIGGADESADIVVRSNVNIWLVVGVGALVLALIVLLLVVKKKK